MSGFPTWLVVAVSGIAGILVLLVVIGAISSLIEDETTSTLMEPTPTSIPTPTSTPVPYLTAAELISAYEDNEFAADQKYKDQIIEITGIVQDFGEDFFDDDYIAITYDPANMDGWSTMGINCHFVDEDFDKVIMLSKGDFIEVRGRNKGDPGFTIVLQDCTILSDKPDPGPSATSTSSDPEITSIDDPLVCDNHQDFSRWYIISEGHNPLVELASLEVHLPKSPRYNDDYYRDMRALVPCNDNVVPTARVSGSTFEELLIIYKKHYPDAGVFTPYLYCERVKKITDIIATALEPVSPTTSEVIQEQVTIIRELDVGSGRLSDEHAYLLAFADALEAALLDIESISTGATPTDMSRIDAVTEAANALAPVVRDVCDPSVIN